MGIVRALLLAAVAMLSVPGATQPSPAPWSPADRLGPLFDAVQMARIFPDGKTFADAVPRRPDAAILADWRAQAPEGAAAIRRFVSVNFDVPASPAAPPPSAARPPIRRHIAALWPVLTRPAIDPAPGDSRIALPAPYVVPGGRFRELYYWDSYFTMLGLAADGRHDLIEQMIDDFGALIDRFGHVPNGTRSYYLSRSQPPVFALMLGLSRETAPAIRQRRLAQLRREHAFWMAGAAGLKPGEAARRVVRLPDGALLNRYWDDRASPRDESWREDKLTAAASGRDPAQVYRDLRAGAESGWDFSARWLGDGRTLATIRTTAIVPADLNALLYGMERTIAELCREARDRGCTSDFTRRATARRRAVDRWLWSAAKGRFVDLDRISGRPTPILSAATLYPLFTGLATTPQARAVAKTVRTQLIAPGGLRTTTLRTGEQWDAPNGWAPLQWIAVAGLRRYGEDATAATIADRFLATAEREYQASGRLLEKYDVEEARPGGGGEYPLQDGFGWTNGVVVALMGGG